MLDPSVGRLLKLTVITFIQLNSRGSICDPSTSPSPPPREPVKAFHPSSPLLVVTRCLQAGRDSLHLHPEYALRMDILVALWPRECKCEKMHKKQRRYTKVHLQSSSGSSRIDLLRVVSNAAVEERKLTSCFVRGMMMITIIFPFWKYILKSEPLLTADRLLHPAQHNEKWD